MRKVNLVVHSGLFFDETATLSHWHIPAAHYLEAWSDARSIDGTVSIVQPLIQPLYGGKSAHEVVATMSDKPERQGYDVVREYWQGAEAGCGRAADVREAVAQVAARWLLERRAGGTATTAARRPLLPTSRRASPPATPSTASRSTSAATRRSTTDASRTTAGCRNCPSRCRS